MSWFGLFFCLVFLILSGRASHAATVVLNYDYVDQGQAGFQLYRCTGPGCTPTTALGSVLGPSVRATSDATAVQGTTYGYGIQALGNGTSTSDSPFSTTLVVTVPVAGVGTHLRWLTQPPASTETLATMDPVQVEVLDGYGIRATSPVSVTVSLVPPGTIDLPNSEVTFVSATSEELSGTAGAGLRSVDGNVHTFWHSQYLPPGSEFLPQGLTIDLRVPYPLTGFRYVPRQDELDFGRILGYEFFVSNDGATWGTAVASGSFANIGFGTNDVAFMTRTARYVHLRANSEVGGRQLAAVAELIMRYSLSGGGSLTGTVTVPASAGVATFSTLALTQAGTYALRATSGTLSEAISTTFAIQDPPPVVILTGPQVRRLGQ